MSERRSETLFSDNVQACKKLLEVHRWPERKLINGFFANIKFFEIRNSTFILWMINRQMMALNTVYAEVKVVTICRTISPIHRKVGLIDPISASLYWYSIAGKCSYLLILLKGLRLIQWKQTVRCDFFFEINLGWVQPFTTAYFFYSESNGGNLTSLALPGGEKIYIRLKNILKISWFSRRPWGHSTSNQKNKL